MKEGKDQISFIVYVFYLLALIGSVVLMGRILYIQIFWKPDSRIEQRLVQRSYKHTLEPQRGNILAADGRILATSFPRYRICVDPSIRKEEYKALRNRDSAAVCEARWASDAHEFALVLHEHFPSQSASWYESKMINARAKDVTYLTFGHPVEKDELEQMREAPLFRLGRNKGGVWGEPVQTRRYPYGNLGYRTIGFSLSGDYADASMQLSEGLDGKYNSMLHGEAGYEYLKRTDSGIILNADSTSVPAVNGYDLYTTLNVDYMDITDKAMRKYLTSDDNIESSCCVLMEVKTGAIRSMINLQRGKDGQLHEYENVAIRRRGEPGSVWKLTTLMTVMEDGHITSTYQTIPTNKSVIPGYRYEEDKHITKDWEQKYHTNRVPIWYGVQISSNYVFRYLAISNYEDRPEQFIDRLYTYKLGEAWPFDLDGLRKPMIPSPDKKKNPYWSKTDLGQVAMGYTVSVTPLHILTFYNAIANRGRMMKPYLVEGFSNGEKRGPAVLNSSICRQAVADTLGECLKKVTEAKGTAWRLANSKCKVAGKTGTSKTYMENVGYEDREGRRQYQGTFVGYFPADDPQYSIICCIYTKPTKKEYYGGQKPVEIVRDVINEISIIDPYWNESL